MLFITLVINTPFSVLGINLESCYKSIEYIYVVRGATNEYLLQQTILRSGLSSLGLLCVGSLFLGDVLCYLRLFSPRVPSFNLGALGLNAESVRTFCFLE